MPNTRAKVQSHEQNRNVFPAVASSSDDGAFDSPYASDTINAPLLPLSPRADDPNKHGVHPHDGLSAFGAAGFMVSIILGLGVLGIPWALAQVRAVPTPTPFLPSFLRHHDVRFHVSLIVDVLLWFRGNVCMYVQTY